MDKTCCFHLQGTCLYKEKCKNGRHDRSVGPCHFGDRCSIAAHKQLSAANATSAARTSHVASQVSAQRPQSREVVTRASHVASHLASHVSVQRPESREVVRHKKNVYIAVDVSGSMAGTGISSVKDCLREVVEKLHDDDNITLMTFNNAVSMVVDGRVKHNKSSALAEIGRLDGRGGTALFDAMVRLVDEAKKTAHKDGIMIQVPPGALPRL